MAIPKLFHHPLCPHSRFVRLILSEYRIEFELIEERVFERRRAFLELDPGGQTPLLIDDENRVIPGALTIAEYIDQVHGTALGPHALLPPDAMRRVEVRRLVHWFNDKFFCEVTSYLVTEKVYKRAMTAEQGGGAPNSEAVRAAQRNLRYHIQYIGYLLHQNDWLAGDKMTWADLAAAAHISCVDYLGEMPWHEDDEVRQWYAAVKSRPSFRPLLAEKMAGIQPGPAYANLDF